MAKTGVDYREIGHLFVVDADIQRLAVDAWMLPSDQVFSITKTWSHTISQIDQSRIAQVVNERWNGMSAVYLDTVDGADVWLGDVGRKPDTAGGQISEDDIHHYVKCARNFIMLASNKVREQHPHRRRLPVVAINHLGTGKGGVRHSHGHVLQALIDALTTDLNNGALRADVVLVSWGERPESAAQFFRHEVGGDWRDNPQWNFGSQTVALHSLAEELASHLRKNSLATFLGAGTSVGAGLKGWRELLADIAHKANLIFDDEALDHLGDLRDQAALLDARLKKRGLKLPVLLQRGLEGSKCSLQHSLLASMPCSEYITTNVDELFEIAFTKTLDNVERQDITVMPEKASHTDRWLLKLHGTISKPDQMVFTRENFLDAGRNSRALLGLVQAMLFTRHMLFVGYGLTDEDFHELVYEVRKAFNGNPINEKIGTVLLIRPEPLKAEIWDDILRIVPVGTSDDLQANARDLERFLDLVGMLSADKYRFFLDPRYNYSGFETERHLQDVLLELSRQVGENASAAAAEIGKTLARLGFDETPNH